MNAGLMEFDDDDLPDGFPNLWSMVVSHLRDWRQKGRGPKNHSRDEARMSEKERARGRAYVERFFTRLGPTDDWQENRRIYNRRKDPRGRQV